MWSAGKLNVPFLAFMLLLLSLYQQKKREVRVWLRQSEWHPERGRERLKQCQDVWRFTMKQSERERARARERGVYKKRSEACPVQLDTQSCFWDVRESLINQPGYIYPLHLVFNVRAHLLGLPEVYGPLVICFALVVVFIKVRGPHGRLWWPRGANQELQPILLQQLQSGKKAEMEESG